MNKTPLLLAFLLALPLVSHAQSLQTFLVNFTRFLGDTLVPFLIGIAFLFFAVNVVRFFVFGSDNQEGQEKAKALAIYSVLAFVIIIIFWGVINLLSSSLGLDGCVPADSDYVKKDFVGPPPPNCI